MKRKLVLRKDDIKTIMLVALIVRLLALLIIMNSGDWSESFLGSGINTDDWRYEAGGLYYAQHANGLIDINAFTIAYANLGDWVGYHLENPFSNAVLWYIIVCILMYITKSVISVRLFNIFLAVISIYYIYKFADLVFGKVVARKSSWLMALLPYPVLFSCFGYKEQLAMFCTFYLLYKAVRYRDKKQMTIRDILKMVFAAVVLMGIRSGISIALIIICFVIMFIQDLNTIKKHGNIFFLLGVAVVVGSFVLYRFWRVISYKLDVYLTSHKEVTDATISFLMINGIRDIYKLPFSYLFSILMPIGHISSITSWSGVVGALSFCMAPIAVGAGAYVFKKKPDAIVYWSCMAYYCIYVITSLNIFRQYASLLPLSLIFYSAWISSVKRKDISFIVCFAAIAVILLGYTLR